MVKQHYRWDFIGLSTDEKPTPETSEKVTDGSTFYCADNSKLYVYCEDAWYEKEAQGGGDLPIASADTLGGIKVGDNLTINSETGVLSGAKGIKVLSSADYNFPTTGDKTDIAIWLLPPGIYQIPVGVRWRWRYGFDPETTISCTVISGDSNSPGTQNPIIYMANGELKGGIMNAYGDFSSPSQIRTSEGYILATTNVIDNLTSSTYTKLPLSAKQGYVLKGLIDSAIINGGTTAPTTATVGSVGTLYSCVNSGTPEIYMCSEVSGSTYTWTKII